MPQAVETSSAEPSATDAVEKAVAVARAAHAEWAAVSIADRLRVVRAVRHDLVQRPEAWAEEITTAGQRSLADSLAAEVLPTADACRFLERNAGRILRPTNASGRDRPLWGRGLRVQTRREPIGVVLVIGAGNYPLFLAAVQALQAIAAGNAVLVKPAPGAQAPMQRLATVLQQAGAPDGLLQVLDETPDAAQRAIEVGVGRIVLTGSASTGRKVLASAADQLTPTTMELSGCDAVFVLPDADLDRVAAALVFGLRLNGSATCIGPRRVFVTPGDAATLSEKLASLLPSIPATVVPLDVYEQAERLIGVALDAGATPILPLSARSPEAFPPVVLAAPTTDLSLLRADLFAPVLSLVEVDSPDAALELSRRCPYALGASVFGPRETADRFAARVEAGCVTVNDLVAPTADPRVAFGGWNESGFGVTRGTEGLLEMTRTKTIITQRADWLPHLDPPRAGLDLLVIGLLRMAHGRSLGERWRGLRAVIGNAKSSTKPRMPSARDNE